MTTYLRRGVRKCRNIHGDCEVVLRRADEQFDDDVGELAGCGCADRRDKQIGCH
jgi:hypothetical protein